MSANLRRQSWNAAYIERDRPLAGELAAAETLYRRELAAAQRLAGGGDAAAAMRHAKAVLRFAQLNTVALLDAHGDDMARTSAAGEQYTFIGALELGRLMARLDATAPARADGAALSSAVEAPHAPLAEEQYARLRALFGALAVDDRRYRTARALARPAPTSRARPSGRSPPRRAKSRSPPRTAKSRSPSRTNKPKTPRGTGRHGGDGAARDRAVRRARSDSPDKVTAAAAAAAEAAAEAAAAAPTPPVWQAGANPHRRGNVSERTTGLPPTAAQNMGGSSRNDASESSGLDGIDDDSIFVIDELQLPPPKPRSGALLRVISTEDGAMPTSRRESDVHATQRWLLAADEVERSRTLGEGMFGVVYQARWRNMDVAVKEVRVGPNTTDEALVQFEDEAITMCRLRPHANVVSLYGVTTAPLALVTEFMPLGALDTWLQTPAGRRAPIGDLVPIIVGVARGVAHLHAEHIVHGDLAARNVLLDDDLNAKVADFGMSLRLEPGADESERPSADRLLPIKWSAPEVLGGGPPTFEADVYSFAVTVCETLNRQPPFATLDSHGASDAVVNRDARPALPTWLGAHGEPLLAMVRECWARDAAARPTMDDVCAGMPARTRHFVAYRKDTMMPISSTRHQHMLRSATSTSMAVASASDDESAAAYDNVADALHALSDFDHAQLRASALRDPQYDLSHHRMAGRPSNDNDSERSAVELEAALDDSETSGAAGAVRRGLTASTASAIARAPAPSSVTASEYAVPALSRRESMRLLLTRSAEGSTMRQLLDTPSKRQFFLDFCDSENVTPSVVFLWRAKLFAEVGDGEARRDELRAILSGPAREANLPDEALRELLPLLSRRDAPPRSALEKAAKLLQRRRDTLALPKLLRHSYAAAVLAALTGAGHLGLPNRIVENFESEGELLDLLGSSAGPQRDRAAPGGGGVWKLVKMADGVMCSELRDGSMYGVRATTLIRRPAQLVRDYLVRLENRAQWENTFHDGRVVTEIGEHCAVWWLGNTPPAARRLVKKRDVVMLRLAIDRTADTFLVLCRSVAHRDVPDKVPGYVRAVIDTSGFVIKWLPACKASLVTYVVFVDGGKRLPQFLYKRFGLQRAKMLANIRRILESHSAGN